MTTVPSDRSTPADATLVGLALRGDRSATDALVRRHYRATFAVALSVVGNRHDAEDVCQDAWVKAIERLEDCREPSRFVAWVVMIVRNRALSFHSYRRVRETSELFPEIAESPASPAVDASRAELAARLEQALGTLSETQRQVVLLHDLEGWNHKDIAGALDMTEVRSRQHLFVARGLLRERLGHTTLTEFTHD